MKTTIAIPCADRHIGKLDRTLTHIMSGTKLPDEIIVGVSPLRTDTQQKMLTEIRSKFDKTFGRLVIEGNYDGLGFVGSRNFLTQFIQGDLVIYHDADDTQHPQRVDIVQRLFHEYDIVHLCHSYRFFSEGQAGRIDYNKIKIFQANEIFEKYKGKHWQTFAFGGGFTRTHAGACCVLKKVLDKVKWSGSYPGEDCLFCLQLLSRFRKTILIDSPLYNYDSPKC